MFGIGMTELMVIFVIGLVVLGPKRLPELARSLGRSLAEFRRASNDMRREFMAVADEVKIEPPTFQPPSPPTKDETEKPDAPETGPPVGTAAGDGAKGTTPPTPRDG
jgi:sec-independent protein translocase protein TatB